VIWIFEEWKCLIYVIKHHFFIKYFFNRIHFTLFYSNRESILMLLIIVNSVVMKIWQRRYLFLFRKWRGNPFVKAFFNMHPSVLKILFSFNIFFKHDTNIALAWFDVCVYWVYPVFVNFFRHDNEQLGQSYEDLLPL